MGFLQKHLVDLTPLMTLVARTPLSVHLTAALVTVVVGQGFRIVVLSGLWSEREQIRIIR